MFVFQVAWLKREFYLKNTYKGALSIPSYVFFLSKTRLVENMI